MGKEHNSYNNAVSKLALNSIKKKISSELSCNLLSVDQAVHFCKDETPWRLAQRNARENYRVFTCAK